MGTLRPNSPRGKRMGGKNEKEKKEEEAIVSKHTHTHTHTHTKIVLSEKVLLEINTIFLFLTILINKSKF